MMKNGLAYGIMAGRGRKALALLCLAGLAGCAPGAEHPTRLVSVDGVPMKVYYADNVFDYVEMFYNPVRKQVRNGMLSPAQFERQQILKAEGV